MMQYLAKNMATFYSLSLQPVLEMYVCMLITTVVMSSAVAYRVEMCL